MTRVRSDNGSRSRPIASRRTPLDPSSAQARRAQRARASANAAPSGISSGGSPEAASIRPLKLKNDTSALMCQTSRSLHPASRSLWVSSASTRLGVSVNLLAYRSNARVSSSRSYSGHVVANSWPRCSSPVRRRTAAVWRPSHGAPPTFPFTTVASISRWSRLSVDDRRRWRCE